MHLYTRTYAFFLYRSETRKTFTFRKEYLINAAFQSPKRQSIVAGKFYRKRFSVHIYVASDPLARPWPPDFLYFAGIETGARTLVRVPTFDPLRKTHAPNGFLQYYYVNPLESVLRADVCVTYEKFNSLLRRPL